MAQPSDLPTDPTDEMHEEELEEEELEEIPVGERMGDPLLYVPVEKCGFRGLVVHIEQGKETKERLYRVVYEDGDIEHFTAEKVGEFRASRWGGPVGGASGTTTKWQEVRDQETQLRFAHIGFLGCYKNKSFEELRMEDYEAQRLQAAQEPAQQHEQEPAQLEEPAKKQKRAVATAAGGQSSFLYEATQEQEPVILEEPAEQISGSRSMRCSSMQKVELTVLLVSGAALGTISATEEWTGAEVRSALRGFVEKGRAIDQLCFGSQVFGNTQTVKELGVLGQSGRIGLSASIVAAPCMHVFKPCSAVELSRRHGNWKVSGGPPGRWIGPDGDGNFCTPEVHHQSMDDAPALAQEVAKEIRVHFDDSGLQLVTVGNNYGKTNEVVVVANVGDHPMEGLVRALGVRQEDLRFNKDGHELMQMAEPGAGFSVWSRANTREADWSKELIGLRFERPPGPDSCSAQGTLLSKVIAITDVMAKSLTRHFEFDFGECLKSPVVWGGFTADGSIVGVLGTYLDC